MLLSNFPNNTTNVLEIGCGTGHAASILSNLYPNIIYRGIDSSQEMVNACLKRKQHLHLSLSDFLHLESAPYPLESNSFDVVFCESVIALQNTNELEEILQEIHRVLKNKGVFILNESLWKTSTSIVLANKINNRVREKFGMIQASSIAYPNKWKKIFSEKGFKHKLFKPLKDCALNESFNKANTPSENFTKNKIMSSMFNLKQLYHYFYFKYWNFRFSKYGNYIEPYFIIYEKAC